MGGLAFILSVACLTWMWWQHHQTRREWHHSLTRMQQQLADILEDR